MIKRVSFYSVSGFLSFILITCAPVKDSDFQAPLLDNLGAYKLAISTRSDYAVQFFNQGMIMANAFNHMEASRAFEEAIRQDSTCAIAYWGKAYVLGPNYNTGSNLGELNEIRGAVRSAIRYREKTQAWEKVLIDAMEVKFPLDKNEVNAEGYMEAMKTAYEQMPGNDLIATLYAESIMNLHAWDLYIKKGGAPKPWTPDIVLALEKAMEINPDNPLANHLYLHAVEAAADVHKALPSAERLKTLVPGAGHLIHMPSHIYINTGDYHEGTVANENAVRVDSIYIAQCKVQGVYPQLYYPHNYHFLAATAALEGNGAKSIEAVFKMSEIIGKNYLTEPGYETTQHYITTPYNVLVKFAQWEKILALPEPELLYPKAIWHYARGMAYANTGNLANGDVELAQLKHLAQTEDLKALLIWEINSAADITMIAQHVLEGELFRIREKLDSAASHFKEAIAIEDGLNYNEPPDWFFSVRHYLGDVLLEMLQPEEAEKVFIEDLMQFPRNGFALNGLYYSLTLQGRETDAQEIKNQFEEAWQHADSELRYSRIDPEKRKDLAIRINENSPQELLYVTAAVCGFN